MVLFAYGSMRLKCISLLVVLLGSLVLVGCVQTLSGRSRGAVPFVKDKIEARYERSPLEIWQAAKDVLRYNGTLYSEDTMKSTLEASVNDRTVWVVPLDTKVSQVLIQVRTKGGGTDMELAGEIDKQIAIRLASGNLTPAASRGKAP
jgi:hypothetical protein